MHPMKTVRGLRTGLLVLLGLLASGAALTAQEPPPRPDATPARNVGSITLPIGGSQRLSMSTKKNIANVFLSGDGVAQVTGGVVPNEVVIRGVAAGAVRLELTDVDGKKENYEIIVQFDVQYVRSLLNRAVPTANIDIIPLLNNAFILTGWVGKVEDVAIVNSIATQMIGAQSRVINAIQVGGVMQVQLDVTVASVNRSEARRRGFSFSVNGKTVVGGSILSGLVTVPSQAAVAPPIGLQIGGLGAAPVGPPNGANIAFGVIPWGFQFLLQALRDESVAKVLAEPKVVTMSGRPAHFLSGGQQAVLSAQGSIGGPGVDFKDVGTEIDVLPVVLGNGRIYLEVAPRFRTVDNAKGISSSFGFVPGFDEQSVRTSIELEPGQTMAIGGLLQTTVNSSSERVPVLGDLPYIGFFFSTVSHTAEEQELVILVTPHLVDAQDCGQLTKRMPGRETRDPDDYELFLEGILEAPRGQRQVFEGGKYKAAYKNDPTYRNIPCADTLPKESRKFGRHGWNGCAPSGTVTAPDQLPSTMNRGPAVPVIEGDVQRIPEGAREVLPTPVPTRGSAGSGLGTPIMPPPPSGDQP
jgi:pilus assembly protein CpaC